MTYTDDVASDVDREEGPTDGSISRRSMFKMAGGAAALAALGSAGSLALGASPAGAASNGHGLSIVAHEAFGRLHYYRFSTNAVGWNPGVNVLLPEDYDQTNWRRYPVMYLFHGGAVPGVSRPGDGDFRFFDMHADIRGLTAGRRIIVVMPDGGNAGWYSNPVHSNAGPRNWETFHMAQLLPWIDSNFRTYAEYDGRAVSGFSMGGFGAMKYAAKYYGHFASVSSHSGPTSLRRDFGTVTHYINSTSSAAELAGGSVYGMPFWNEARVTADNPCQRVPSYHHKRVFLVCGTGWEPQENQVRAGQREFRGLLRNAGIPHEWHEVPGPNPHSLRRHLLQQDIDGAIARLRKA